MQTYQELTILSTKDQKNLSQMRLLLQQGMHEFMVGIVSTYSLAQLFKLSLNDKQVHDFLAGSEFNTVWLQRFKEVWPTACELNLQDGVSHFDRLLSYFLLARYFTYQNHPHADAQQAQKLLRASAKLGNFHAMRLWLVQQAKNLSLETKFLHNYIKVLDSLAVRHHSPGCLEAAYGYFKLAQQLKQWEAQHVFHDTLSARFCFLQAIEMVILAEQLCQTRGSELAIANAYAGKGLVAGNNHQFNDFSELRLKLFQGSNLSKQDYTILLAKLHQPFANEQRDMASLAM